MADGMEGEVAEPGMNVEVLMPEVMSMVLERVDQLSWPCVRLVCRRWNDLLLGHASACWHSRRHRVVVAAPRDYSARLAYEGRLGVLQWAVSQGCSVSNTRVCSEAARGGHLDVLQWARAMGSPWDVVTCANAAWSGELGILKWARANGCPWEVSTTVNAARRGHLEVLRWAVANGCRWNERTMNAALQGGDNAILAYLRQLDSSCTSFN